MTRPDIAYQVGQLTRFISKYGQDQISAVKYLLRYLKGTINKAIKYDTKCGEQLITYTDATWANDSDMRSVSGNVFLLAGGAISWLAKSQSSLMVSYLVVLSVLKNKMILRDFHQRLIEILQI